MIEMQEELNEIYDPDEYERALIWTKENCIQGFDANDEDLGDDLKKIMIQSGKPP